MNAIEARLTEAKTDIDALAQGIVGPLRIGAYESVGTHLLPEVVGQFGEEYPQVRVEVDDATLDLELLRSLERGALDVAFAIPPLPSGPFETQIGLNDRWVLVARTGSEHAALTPPLTLRDIAELPLVCFKSSRAIDPALSRFRELGVEPQIIFRSDYNEIVQGFVAAGLGVALMPRLAVNAQDERTEIIELEGLIPPRQIAIVWQSERPTSDALRTFVSLAVEIGAQLEAAGSHGREERASYEAPAA
jgi:DNA-binding transcriptional LysR family regulator